MNIHEEISKVAYELYEKSGNAEGRDLENWLEAENIVLERNTSPESERAETRTEGQANPSTPETKPKARKP